MPLFRAIPDKPIRVANNVVTAVAANSDAPKATMFTVPTGRKFTVYAVGTDQNAANVFLIAFHIIGTVAVALVDIPTQRLPTDERITPIYEVFGVGESLTLGLRNNTAAAITPQLVVYYSDEPA